MSNILSWKGRDENHTPWNSQSFCLFYTGFDRVLGTALSVESPSVHNSLVSWDSNLLTPKSSLGLEVSQLASEQASKVTLVLKPVHKEALLPEQLQCIRDPYTEELFDKRLEEQPTPELTAEEAEVAPDPSKFLAAFCGC